MGTDPGTTTKGLFQLLKNMKWSPPPNINYFPKKRCDWKYTFYRSRNNSHINCTNLTIGTADPIFYLGILLMSPYENTNKGAMRSSPGITTLFLSFLPAGVYPWRWLCTSIRKKCLTPLSVWLPPKRLTAFFTWLLMASLIATLGCNTTVLTTH